MSSRTTVRPERSSIPMQPADFKISPFEVRETLNDRFFSLAPYFGELEAALKLS
jgi:hypothetical protein